MAAHLSCLEASRFPDVLRLQLSVGQALLAAL